MRPNFDIMRAACREVDPELFFPVGHSGLSAAQALAAKNVCRLCPVVRECLTYALDTGQDFGIWGGMDEEERRLYLRQHRPQDEPRHRWTNVAELAAAGETKEQIAVRLKLAPRTVEKYLKMAEQS